MFATFQSDPPPRDRSSWRYRRCCRPLHRKPATCTRHLSTRVIRQPLIPSMCRAQPDSSSSRRYRCPGPPVADDHTKPRGRTGDRPLVEVSEPSDGVDPVRGDWIDPQYGRRGRLEAEHPPDPALRTGGRQCGRDAQPLRTHDTPLITSADPPGMTDTTLHADGGPVGSPENSRPLPTEAAHNERDAHNRPATENTFGTAIDFQAALPPSGFAVLRM